MNLHNASLITPHIPNTFISSDKYLYIHISDKISSVTCLELGILPKNEASCLLYSLPPGLISSDYPLNSYTHLFFKLFLLSRLLVWVLLRQWISWIPDNRKLWTLHLSSYRYDTGCKVD